MGGCPLDLNEFSLVGKDLGGNNAGAVYGDAEGDAGFVEMGAGDVFAVLSAVDPAGDELVGEFVGAVAGVDGETGWDGGALIFDFGDVFARKEKFVLIGADEVLKGDAVGLGVLMGKVA